MHLEFGISESKSAANCIGRAFRRTRTRKIKKWKCASPSNTSYNYSHAERIICDAFGHRAPLARCMSEGALGCGGPNGLKILSQRLARVPRLHLELGISESKSAAKCIGRTPRRTRTRKIEKWKCASPSNTSHNHSHAERMVCDAFGHRASLARCTSGGGLGCDGRSGINI